MNTNGELLQRCFDMDLNDDEMKKLFLDLSKDGDLRKSFRSFQSLQNDLHSVPQPIVPLLLDERIGSIRSKLSMRLAPNKASLRNIIFKKFSVPIVAIAAFIMLLFAGSYVGISNLLHSEQKMEYIYVVQLPPVVIQSTYSH